MAPIKWHPEKSLSADPLTTEEKTGTGRTVPIETIYAEIAGKIPGCTAEDVREINNSAFKIILEKLETCNELEYAGTFLFRLVTEEEAALPRVVLPGDEHLLHVDIIRPKPAPADTDDTDDTDDKEHPCPASLDPKIIH